MSLDKLTLDAMVSGTEEGTEVWRDLLLDPKREILWQEAVERRELLNRFCALSAKWPKLAMVFRGLKKLSKSSSDSSNLSCVLGPISEQPFAAMMRNMDEKRDIEDLLIDISWGDQQLIDLEAPKKIRFQASSDVHIHYEYTHGRGWISSLDYWEFRESEGAVVLTFCETSIRSSEDLELVAQQAEAVASIVLIPA